MLHQTDIGMSWMTVPNQSGLYFGDGFNLASTSATSPGDGPGTAFASPTQSHKRNASAAGLDSSPTSLGSPDINGDGDTRDGRRRPVKRACNECRQQKVSHQNTELLYAHRCFYTTIQSDYLPPYDSQDLSIESLLALTGLDAASASSVCLLSLTYIS